VGNAQRAGLALPPSKLALPCRPWRSFQEHMFLAHLHVFILKERGTQTNGLLITYSAEDGGECKEDVNVDVANEIIEKLSFSFTEFLLDD
jgi:hypothetical protein